MNRNSREAINLLFVLPGLYLNVLETEENVAILGQKDSRRAWHEVNSLCRTSAPFSLCPSGGHVVRKDRKTRARFLRVQLGGSWSDRLVSNTNESARGARGKKAVPKAVENGVLLI